MLNDITILVGSCDKNKDLFEPFHYCMEKYWNDHPRIVYSTETAINPFYETITLNYSLNEWSWRIRDTVKQLDTKFVLFMVDDIFIQRQVDSGLIQSLTKYIKDTVAAINFEQKYNAADRQVNELLSVRSDNGKYKVSMMCQLWNRQKFIATLGYCGDPWAFERANNHCGYRYLISNRGDFLYWGRELHGDRNNWGLYRGKWSEQAKQFFTNEGLHLDFSSR